MPCCGEKRARIQVAGVTSPPREPSATQRPMRYEVAFFQYLGKTRLTATGPATGKRYRFASPGATVAVGLRDRPYLAKITNLRQVRGPVS